MNVTLAISTHNRRQGLSALLGDIGRQNVGQNLLEVLVVDSVEGDDISGVVAQHALNGLDVRRILAPNVLAAKRNAAAVAASGSLLIFLDDDMRVPADFVVAHISAHVQSRTSVSGQVKFPADWVAESNYYRYKNSRHMSVETEFTRRIRIEPHHVVAMNLSMSAAFFHELGGFDESFVHYGGEDIEFGFRSARNGGINVYSPLPEAIHCEVGGDIGYFARKIYAATFYGTQQLSELVPEMRSVKTFRWTEPESYTQRSICCVALARRPY
jgi:GT2 family glycosyltransferase